MARNWIRPGQDDKVARSIGIIQAEFGDRVSIEDRGGALLKFGRNDDIDTGTEETVWQSGGNETYPTTNAITHISSSSAADTQDVVVQGHTIASGLLTSVSQTVTLNGQNKVALTTALARADRQYNDGTVDFAGTVYVYEDDTVTAGVPDTAAKIHLQTDGVNNQSLKAAASIAQNEYWIITQLFGGVRRNTGTPNVDFQVQIREVSASSKVFRTRIPYTSGVAGALITLETPLIVPKNHDFRIVAGVSVINTSVIAWAAGPLATIR